MSPRRSSPVLYVGGGVIKADAHAELLRLAELARAPVVTTLMARGAFPDSHPLHLGMPGMHGTFAAVAALQEADLLVALGARFDDRVTGKLALRAARADRARRHRPGRDRQEPARRRGDRGRLQEVIAELIAAVAGRARSSAARATTPHGGRSSTAGSGSSRCATRSRRRPAEAAVRGRAAVRADRRRRDRRWPASASTRCTRPSTSSTKPRSWINSGGAGHDGLRGPRRDGRQGRHAGRAGGGDRRRRLLPDDRPGAGHLRDRGPADQGRDLQQRLPRHGPPVAGAVLRRALLEHQPRRQEGRGRGHPHPGLREAGRGLRLLRPALRAADDVDA